ncbi:MAG: hypothetical protein LBR70_07100 [Lactobacillaceae bacterium]|jgi:hypothetical protein|nr:hypothetical protein [Lactobacillaceae bacterium]
MKTENQAKEAFAKNAKLLGNPLYLEAECKSGYYNYYADGESIDLKKGETYNLWFAFGDHKFLEDRKSRLFFLGDDNKRPYENKTCIFIFVLGGKDLNSLVDAGDFKTLTYFLKRGKFKTKNAHKVFRKYVKDTVAEGKDKDKINAELARLKP